MAALPFIFLFFQLLFVIFFLYMCVASVTGAPFVPSQKGAADAMIRLANIKKSDTVYDLGSGNGKLLFLSHAKAIGYEINPILVLFTNLKAFYYRNKNVHAYWKNFWKARITDADVVFIYLLPWKMDRLAEKLKKECKPGTRIVSNSFIFPSWTVIKKDTTNHIYLFRV